YWLHVFEKYGIAKDRLLGVDISPSNVSKLSAEGFGVVCANVLTLPLHTAAFKFTLSIGVIHHTPEPFRAFQELVRITKPGGLIYLSVYNKWNPYYYIVHKAAFPIRFLYWNWSKKTASIVYPLSKILYQPLALLLLGKFLDDKSGRALFMDQVMTPRAFLFSKKDIRSYAAQCNCSVEEIRYTNHFFMLTSIIRKNSGTSPGCG
ncbi:MAG: class I SAM-dependent methyltransferase, partial [Candidatus Altiarchaeota archaeon]|nr:class I SAM-dependent methyltransferase [Candidatus Altiarchaeota archaeon]